MLHRPINGSVNCRKPACINVLYMHQEYKQNWKAFLRLLPRKFFCPLEICNPSTIIIYPSIRETQQQCIGVKLETFIKIADILECQCVYYIEIVLSQVHIWKYTTKNDGNCVYLAYMPSMYNINFLIFYKWCSFHIYIIKIIYINHTIIHFVQFIGKYCDFYFFCSSS